MLKPKQKRRTVKVYESDYVFITSQAPKEYKESFADLLARLVEEVRA